MISSRFSCEAQTLIMLYWLYRRSGLKTSYDFFCMSADTALIKFIIINKVMTKKITKKTTTKEKKVEKVVKVEAAD